MRATREHGGKFVMSGGLTMAGAQAEYTLAAARCLDPGLEPRLRALYRWPEGGRPEFGPPPDYNTWLGLTVRELCAKHGLIDRMPRYIAPGPLAINKRIAELLFLKTYDLELEQAGTYRIWAYRKAAWTVDELPESIRDIWQARGEEGLRVLPAIGKVLAAEIARWLKEESH